MQSMNRLFKRLYIKNSSIYGIDKVIRHNYKIWLFRPFDCHVNQKVRDCSKLQLRNCSTDGLLVEKVLEDFTTRLQKESVPESELQAEYIVSTILGVNRTLLGNFSKTIIPQAKLEKMEKMMSCRLARMPLQYILGEWGFHSITINVRPPVFIPRQETEQLVELSLEFLSSDSENPLPKILDICCGTGSIGLALLKNLPNAKCIAIDQSKYAIALTEENASKLNLSDRLIAVEGRITQDDFPILHEGLFDLIVSNPPYVLRKDLLEVQPEIMLYEDLRALDGGIDGLDIIKKILFHSQHLLKSGGAIFLEIDPCHKYLLPQWLEKEASIRLTIAEIYKDVYQRDRFIKFIKP